MEMGVYTEDDVRAGGELGDGRTRLRLRNAAHIAYDCLYLIEGGELDEPLLRHLCKQEKWPGGRLVREIAGNPFRPVPLEPGWLSWNDCVILKLARAVYDGRTYDHLPILGDALEEAGCADAALLSHLRGPAPHVLGCHALDLLLGKS
jgi:hypothetical protein